MRVSVLNRISIRHQLLLLIAAAVLVTSIAFGMVSYRSLRRELLNGIDSKLFSAAMMAGRVPPGDLDYFNNLDGPESISPEDYDRLVVAQNNALSDELGLQYLWSCMLVDGYVRFTTSTSPPRKDEEEGRYRLGDAKHARFWQKHSDPKAFETVFRTMQPHYSSFHNQWGHGRMVLVPGLDNRGRKYCFGASMSINDVHALLTQNLGQTGLLAVLALLASLGLGRILAGYVSRPIEQLTTVAEGISEGDLTQNIEVEGSAELVSLADSIQNMAASIQETIAALQKEVNERWQAEQKLEKHKGRLEEQVNIRTKELQRSNADLEQFAYIASHDLQEPLRKIITFSDRLSSKYAECLDEKGLDYLSRMQNAASRMRQLITDLLSYSRVTTKAEPYSKVDLNQVAKMVCQDLEVCIREVNGRVDIGELPTIEADGTQMRQLLQNLISNGLKFHTDDDPPVVTVVGERFDSPRNTRMCRLSVSDNGIGFERKYADRIFKIFQRLHVRGKYPGTGVGLATCARIVDRHNGTLRAKGNPGEGATFIAELPVEQKEG